MPSHPNKLVKNPKVLPKAEGVNLLVSVPALADAGNHSDILDRDLADYDWESIGEQLTTFADCRMRRALGHKGKQGGIQGKTASDFAWGAISKLLGCDRNWNRKKCPDVMVLLKGVVRSDLSEAYRKVLRNKSGPVPEEASGESTQFSVDHDPGSKLDFEIISGTIGEILKQVNDPVIALCWKAMVLNEMTAQELSREEGIPLQEVYNGRRRLKYLMSKVVSNLQYKSYAS